VSWTAKAVGELPEDPASFSTLKISTSGVIGSKENRRQDDPLPLSGVCKLRMRLRNGRVLYNAKTNNDRKTVSMMDYS